MEKLRKIKKGSNNNNMFDWILEDPTYADSSINNSMMIRELVIQYNQIVDHIVKLEGILNEEKN